MASSLTTFPRFIPSPSAVQSAAISQYPILTSSMTSTTLLAALSNTLETPASGPPTLPPTKNTGPLPIPLPPNLSITSMAASSPESSFLMLSSASPTPSGTKTTPARPASKFHGPPSLLSFPGAGTSGSPRKMPSMRLRRPLSVSCESYTSSIALCLSHL